MGGRNWEKRNRVYLRKYRGWKERKVKTKHWEKRDNGRKTKGVWGGHIPSSRKDGTTSMWPTAIKRYEKKIQRERREM